MSSDEGDSISPSLLKETRTQVLHRVLKECEAIRTFKALIYFFHGSLEKPSW